MSIEKIKVAILDMNNNAPNQGLRCIKEIVESFSQEVNFRIFDVRAKNDIPDTSFDIYISSGGPGSPLEDGVWRIPYLNLMENLWNHNKVSEQKKHVFVICYSFQVMCHYFELGEIKLRKSTSFGILPIHKTKKGIKDPLLDGLNDPFYAVDSRDWQLVQPRLKVFQEHGATILSLEKIRTHIELERAIMAVRFSKEFVGTQFHPEADPVSMEVYFSLEETKELIIKNFGKEKYIRMMDRINHPEKVMMTYSTILPKFIKKAISSIQKPILA
ncbi:MAG: GMP synthase [Polaribacter sp.]|uniref:type 1 glutamine amidotransferase n=1 Tax=Polaribacter sp. TaxID=1920175 RepID=UPI003BB0D51B